jgi:hypothetical protein
VQYVVNDANPAWLKLVRMDNCNKHPGPRWGKLSEERFRNFATILNAGINGSAPISSGIEPASTPKSFWIVSLSPNPFNPSTTIRFELSEAMPVTMGIWSVEGARVKALTNGKVFGAGDNRVTWDGRDDLGSPVASGVYFVRLGTRLGVDVRRGVLLK